MKNFKKIGALLFLSSYLIICSPVLAADTSSVQFTPQIGIPGTEFQQGVSTPVGKTVGNVITSDLIGRYVAAFYKWGLSIVGVLAVLMLMAGGLIWLTSRGDSGKIGQAKKMISGSLLGSLLLVGAYFFLNTINPDLTKLPAIEVENIKNTAVETNTIICCSSTSGEKKISAGACPSNYATCDNDQTCGKKGDSSFSCIDNNTLTTGGKSNNSLCCEYKSKNAATNHLRCLTSTTGKCPPPENGGFLGVDYTFSKSYPNFSCNAGVLYADSCKYANSCQGVKDGEECPGVDQKYDGAYCYDGKCWANLGDPGEPCGNDGGSFCVKTGSDCKDRDLSGGRSCGRSQGSFCCHTVK
jgi:hypothetical protein